jgi:hypothetical protein
MIPILVLMAAVFLAAPPARGQQQQASRPGWPCAGKVDPSYILIAEATGGSVLLFHPSELGAAGSEMSAAQRHRETVFRAGGPVEEGNYEFTVPVDSTIESVFFLVSMQCLQLATVVTPSGELLNVSAPGVEYHHFEALRMFVVDKPAPGTWKVTAGGRGLFSLIVRAKTDLTLGRVSFAERGKPFFGLSMAKKALDVETSLSGAADRIGFQFISSRAAPIGAFDLAVDPRFDDARRYVGQVTTPDVDFRVAVTGLDPRGFPFQRVDSRLFIAKNP